ncbi:MAG: Rieske 2Fe-2S domain-containing protein [Thermoproteota archaeon]|nr:Rieske 2Fe-2S domain-containing protein [Thermoproteota archaeon]
MGVFNIFSIKVVALPSFVTMLHKICNSNDLGDNSMFNFSIKNSEVLVGRRRGRLFACKNSCPHRSASLSKGEFNEDNIVCCMYGYEFNLLTGNLEHIKSCKKEMDGTKHRMEKIR